MASEPALRARREIYDYAKANGGAGAAPAAPSAGGAPGGGGSYLRVFIRLRPSDVNSTGELPYSFPEPNKISIKENREPFPAEHQFAFHKIYDKGATQVRVAAVPSLCASPSGTRAAPVARGRGSGDSARATRRGSTLRAPASAGVPHGLAPRAAPLTTTPARPTLPSPNVSRTSPTAG